MKIYICNALAMGMLDRDVQERNPDYRAAQGSPRTPRPITIDQALKIIGCADELVGAVGHADTAGLIASALNLATVQVHGRITVRLRGGPDGLWADAEKALIGAYTGPRLPEGCTTLPEGAVLEWWVI